MNETNNIKNTKNHIIPIRGCYNMIFCIHDNVQEVFKKQIKKTDILTFDDAHYNVFKYRNQLDEIECKKILFITPIYVSFDKRLEEPSESYYQWDFRINKKNQFLNIYEIEELLKKHNFELGMHSYFHDFVYVNGKNDNDRLWRMYKLSQDVDKMKIFNKMYSIQSKLSTPGYDVFNQVLYKRNNVQYEEFIKSDTYMCREWFKDNLYIPDKYAYPFFQGSIELDSELYRYGIKNIYGQRDNILKAVDINDNK